MTPELVHTGVSVSFVAYCCQELDSERQDSRWLSLVLDLPVRGTVKFPQFSLCPIVVQGCGAFGNGFSVD